LEVVKRVIGDVARDHHRVRDRSGESKAPAIEPSHGRCALRHVLKRLKQWRRLEDDVKMLTESGGEPIGRVLTSDEQEHLFKTAESNAEWSTCTAPRSSRREHLDARRRSEARAAQRSGVVRGGAKRTERIGRRAS
jgi:hypothetical protein